LIAYAIKQVENSDLEFKLIPLGLAILSWALSFYFGVTSIRKIISARITDEFRKQTDSLKNYPDLLEKAKEQFLALGNLANKYNRNMYRLLYSGGLFYILWRLIEMIIKTKC
jgi:hypothetical protein